MSETVIIGILFSVIQAAFWLWVRTSMARVERIETAAMQFQLMVANNYVKQTQLASALVHFDKSIDEIKKMIERIADR